MTGLCSGWTPQRCLWSLIVFLRSANVFVSFADSTTTRMAHEAAF